MHRCTWKGCGAPATKKIRIRLRHPVKCLREDGTIYEEITEGRDLWRCEKHYQEQSEHWQEMEDSGIFIVER